jgi:hypothetical protein
VEREHRIDTAQAKGVRKRGLRLASYFSGLVFFAAPGRRVPFGG